MSTSTFSGPVQSLDGFNMDSGAGKRMGTAVLVAGTVTVTNPQVVAGSVIMLQRKTVGGTVGDLTFAVTAGTSFTITSASATDTSTVVWVIFNPTTVNP